MPAKKHQFAVGDWARNIESGWKGKIVAFEDVPDLGPLVRMQGVDWLVQTVCGLSNEEALTPDDIHWFSTDDLVPLK
jgi:hypothetical protein